MPDGRDTGNLGRIGRVTGRGIAGNVCRNFGASAVWFLVLLLFVANTIIALAVVHVPSSEAIRGLLIPKMTWSSAFLTTLVEILATTISPSPHI